MFQKRYCLRRDKMANNIMTLPLFKCPKCDHEWVPRKDNDIVICPVCGKNYLKKVLIECYKKHFKKKHNL